MNKQFQWFVKEFKEILPKKIKKHFYISASSETIDRFWGFPGVEFRYKKEVVFRTRKFADYTERRKVYLELSLDTIGREFLNYKNMKYEDAVKNKDRPEFRLFILLDQRTTKKTLENFLVNGYLEKDIMNNNGLEDVYKFRFNLEGIAYDQTALDFLKLL